MDFLSLLASRAKIIDQAMDKMLPPETVMPATIHQAMRYSLMAGGKRLRPALVMGAAEAVGCPAHKVMPAACAMELIHTYSLVHDDLPAMDNDDLRRGKPTNHKVFGEAVAILAGDALLTLAFQLIAENASSAPPGAVIEVTKEFATAAGSQGMIGGQVVDTLAASHEINADMLDYIHRHKTGALFRAAVRAGAILGEAKEAQLAALTQYAESLGLAFQIIDDILDEEGDTNKLGKPVGSDQKNQKTNYPTLFGMDIARQKAQEMADQAQQALGDFGPQADFLRSAVNFIINREH